MIPAANRRAHERIPCELEVHVDGLDVPVALTTRDVSLGGIFLFTTRPIELDRRVELRLEAGTIGLELTGTVVHALPGVGVGVKFTDLDHASRDQLATFLRDAGRD